VAGMAAPSPMQEAAAEMVNVYLSMAHGLAQERSLQGYTSKCWARRGGVQFSAS